MRLPALVVSDVDRVALSSLTCCVASDLRVHDVRYRLVNFEFASRRRFARNMTTEAFSSDNGRAVDNPQVSEWTQPGLDDAIEPSVSEPLHLQWDSPVGFTCVDICVRMSGYLSSSYQYH